MKAEMIVKTYAKCPECPEGQFGICHPSGNYGPWGCDECGARFMFTIRGMDVEMTREADSDVPGWLVVEIAESDPPLYAVVDSMIYFRGKDYYKDRDLNEHNTYWVNEHTCPTNLVRAEVFVYGDSADPHGILRYLAHFPKKDWAERMERNEDETWRALVAEAVKIGAKR